ncbi:hypothetical protein EKO23_16475 [Nocardioides guangzhouensis]|uniref:Carboxypeptidase regulatory-like domain-containing protein n=1 Tax=Nocardioides guangzhouensis TaxID=2497878 RepID=A0A4Q4Z8V2_9ACTN|nr:hypothetical protein [Nocardioides guangzhouensis]RYP84252.1 hypothetical protein EKO23_16475 [Nocardioides guangzhouensis]
MRRQRLLVGVLGTALVGAFPVALTSTSAVAGTALASSVDGQYYGAPDGNGIWRFGQRIRFEATVTVQCDAADPLPYGCSPVDETGDTIALQRRLAGTTAWRTVTTKQATGALTTLVTPSVGRAVYRIVYSGGTSQGYAGSRTGNSPTLKGSRNPHGKAVLTRRGTFYRGNVDPGWGRKPVTIQKKNCAAARCGWHTYATVRTTRNGSYSARITVPRTGRFIWRSTVKDTLPRFVRGYGVQYYTTRSRLPARAVVGR